MNRILIVLGMLIIVAGCLLLKISTPSPHGLIETVFAAPLIAVGALLLSTGLFLTRRMIAAVAGALVLLIALGAATPLLALVAFRVFDDKVEDIPHAAYYPLRVILGMTGFVLSPFVDSNPRIEGRVFRWIDPPSDARSQVFLGDSVPPGLRLAPLGNARVRLWEDKSYQEHLDCQESLRTKGVCLGPPVCEECGVRSDNDGRYELNFRPFGPGTLTAEKDGCRVAIWEIKDYLESGTVLASFILVCDSPVNQSRGEA
ncbi:MAG: hypothetical protein ACREMK_07780 [Gemmatimonadota bacterium]